MNITVINLEAIQKAVTERVDRMTPVFTDAVEQEKERIKTRTQAGQDVEGAQFFGYSKKWKKVRETAGKQTAHVDLTFTGGMFNSLRTASKRDGNQITSTIFFDGADSNEKARRNQNEIGRYFFGISNEQMEIIKSKLRQVS